MPRKREAWFKDIIKICTQQVEFWFIDILINNQRLLYFLEINEICIQCSKENIVAGCLHKWENVVLIRSFKVKSFRVHKIMTLHRVLRTLEVKQYFVGVYH